MLDRKKFLILLASEIDLGYGIPTETLTREHFDENPMATWETHSDFIRFSSQKQANNRDRLIT